VSFDLLPWLGLLTLGLLLNELLGRLVDDCMNCFQSGGRLLWSGARDFEGLAGAGVLLVLCTGRLDVGLRQLG
jgi:hypothetical protein